MSDERSCTEKSLEALRLLPASNLFSIQYKDATDPPGIGSSLPSLFIECRHSSSVTGSKVSVDGLGSSGKLMAKGYFQGFGGPRTGGSIHLLYDRFSDEKELETTLRHELMHAVDHSVHGLDMTTCAGLACSESRASAAGECSELWGWFRGSCIRSTAAASTAMVFPVEGSHCVRAVYSQCSSLGPEHSPVAYIESLLGVK